MALVGGFCIVFRMTRFRPCIDLHQGKVKQIVGGSLRDDGAGPVENFVSDKAPGWFAERFRDDQLTGGHVIKLGPGNDPAAREVRKLVGEHLPELINGYKRIPDSLKRKEHGGKTPEQQLLDGLKLIDREIETMTGQISRGELDKLAQKWLKRPAGNLPL